MAAEARVFVERRKRERHLYVQGFLQFNVEGAAEVELRLRDHSIGLQAMRVLMTMCARTDYENRVQTSQKELGLMLGMSSPELSKACRTLLDCGFIERMSHRGWYCVSPRLMWRGSTKNLRKALAERGMLDPNGMMTGRAA